MDDKMIKSDLNNYEYTYPEFRYGRICESIPPEKFNFEQAEKIQQTFREKQSIINEMFKKCFERQGITCDFLDKEYVKKNKKGFFAELLEGPAVLFEHLKLQLDGFDTEFRPSLTICTHPNRSKIWLRYSYNREPFKLNKNGTKQFFDAANNASKRIADLLVNEYKKILTDKGFSKDMKSIHTIIIKALSTNDSAVKNLTQHFCPDAQGSIAENIQKEENDKLLRQFLYFTSEENYGNPEWFGLKFNNSTAIYAKFNKDDLTEFVGFGNNLNGSVVPYEKSVTHKVSIALIKVIAPHI